MKISLRNVGKLASADVELNGITVIAGDNDTGKSTVGKALYSVFNGLYEAGKQVEKERNKIYQNEINHLFNQMVYSSSQATAIHHRKRSEAYAVTNKTLSETTLSGTELESYLFDLLFASLSDDEAIDKASLRRAVTSIVEAYSIPDSVIQQKIIQNAFMREFHGNISNLFSSDPATVKLTVQSKTASISFSDNSVSSSSIPFVASTKLLYCDDPFILDLGNLDFMHRYGDHRDDTIQKILRRSSPSKEVITEILSEQKLENAYSLLSSVTPGYLSSDEYNFIVYHFPKSSKTIDARNLSTGMKTFAIIKQLLSNGSIRQNGTLILDEPEIHLHPAWQLVFAELIVLLQKEFGLHILLNTHSPYFLNAIEVYSAKHGIADKCKYYLAENNPDGQSSVIRDVTTNIEAIYKSLAGPIQELINEEARLD